MPSIPSYPVPDRPLALDDLVLGFADQTASIPVSLLVTAILQSLTAALPGMLETIIANLPDQADGDEPPANGLYLSGDGVVKNAKNA